MVILIQIAIAQFHPARNIWAVAKLTINTLPVTGKMNYRIVTIQQLLYVLVVATLSDWSIFI